MCLLYPRARPQSHILASFHTCITRQRPSRGCRAAYPGAPRPPARPGRVSLVLVVVGIKMILNAWFGTKVIPTEIALLITAVLIGGSIVFSLLKTRGKASTEPRARAWWVPGSPARKKNPGD